jgi:hypothetical protein
VIFDQTLREVDEAVVFGKESDEKWGKLIPSPRTPSSRQSSTSRRKHPGDQKAEKHEALYPASFSESSVYDHNSGKETQHGH